MEDIRVRQMEALKMADEYLEKLIPNMEALIEELNGEEKEDTQEYLNQVIEGLNFMIETFNVTMSLINEDKTVIDKDEINRVVLNLSDAMISKNYRQAATIMDSGILPFLKALAQSAALYC